MSLATADLLIEHAFTAVTCAGPAPLTGSVLGRTGAINQPAVASSGGRIVYAGPASALADHVDLAPRAMRIDATDCSLLPGFVDAAPAETAGADGDEDAGAEWALAHGVTTWISGRDRRKGATVLAPAEALLDNRANVPSARPRVAAGEPVAVTACARSGGALHVSTMPYALMVGSLAMGLTVDEAVVAATLNAAWSLECDGECGSLEPGKRMDVVVVKGRPGALLRVGAPAVRMVIREGKLVSRV